MGLDKSPMHRRRQPAVLCLAGLLVLASASCLAAPTPAPRPALRTISTPAPAAAPSPTQSAVPLPARPARPTPTPTPSYRITTASVDETIAVAGLVMTVARIPAPDPELERQRVVLDLAIQNVGEDTVSIDSARELVLKDSTNQIYRISPAVLAAIGKAPPDVDLAPGETIRTQAAFDAPITATGLMLSFAADKFGAGRIFVRLPDAAEAALAGALPEAPTETPTAPAVVTATLASPTAEIAATPLPTSTLTLTATATLPSPTSPAAPAAIAVTLLAPNDGDTLGDSVTFGWAVTEGSLPSGQAFEVIFYDEGQDPLRDGFGLAAPTLNNTIQVNLADLDADPNFPLEPGTYLWGVRLVEQDTGRPIRMAAEGRRLVFERLAPIPPPEPTPTPIP